MNYERFDSFVMAPRFEEGADGGCAAKHSYDK